MDKIIINGGKKLYGKVKISGAKNAALPILFATMLTDEECTIENVPHLVDIKTACALLEFFGKKIKIEGDKISIHTIKIPHKPEAPYELVKKMRASFLIAGALLSRFGYARISMPGGCAIGVRPVDIHLYGLKKLGAKISIDGGYLTLRTKRLKGTVINLSYPSVGATENLLIAATLSYGKTIIKGAAREPEIADLSNFLNSIGANIKGIGTKNLTVTGVKKLNACPSYKIIPDRIETGTFLIAGAITKGVLEIQNCNPGHISLLINLLKEAGFSIRNNKTSIKIKYKGRKIKAVSITTAPYPGFPTDLQAQWMALMTTANGESVIRETVFENRFMHVGEFQRLGAELKIKGDTVIIRGAHLTGAPIMVSDLRAGASLILAGLVADGITTIERVYHIDRGYENIEAKLFLLGADIRRIKD
ncbi:MAG: UDP-N-acetylglucosamine 1-carboxyvinyltransferase [Elusimicrobiota bacterium]